MSDSAATLYFHGIPGSRGELALFGQWPKSNFKMPFVPERGSTIPEQDAVHYFDHLANLSKDRKEREDDADKITDEVWETVAKNTKDKDSVFKNRII